MSPSLPAKCRGFACLRAEECTIEVFGDTSGMQRVSSRTTAENLVSILSSHPEGILVEDPSGAEMGIVTPASLIQSLASAESKRYNDAD